MIWSVSSDKMWSRCQRQYFFKHIMANARANDEKRRLAQTLGVVQQIPWWQGTVVHKTIENYLIPALQRGSWPSEGKIVSEARNLATRQFMFSNDKLYETVQKADEQEDYCILAPHFFDEPIDADTLEKSIEVITSALQNLITNPVMREFFIGRKAYFTEKILQFKVGKTTVRAIPDLIMPMDKDHGIDIVDWKVATTSSSHHFQVGVYALAIRQTSWLSHYDLNNIRGYVINLLLPDPSISLSDPYTVQDDTLNYIIDSIYEKSEHVEALKRGRKFKELDISQFRYAKSEGSCATCNWCQLCKEMGDGTPDKLFPDQKSGPTQLALPLI